MKKLLSIALLMLMTFTVLLNVSCDKTEENKEDPKKEDPKKEDPSEIPEIESDYVCFENQSEFKDWNTVLLGKNGIDYYYEFQDNGKPEKFAIWNRNKDSVEIFTQFDDQGLPSYMFAGEYTFVFGNYRDNAFSLAVSQNGEILLLEDSIYYDIDRKEKMSLKSRSHINDAKYISALLSAIGCAVSLTATVGTGGLTGTLALISCSSAVVTVWDAACLGCMPEWLSAIATVGGCTDPIGCVASAAQIDLTVRAMIEDKMEEINKSNALFTIQVDAYSKDVGNNSATILLPIIHQINPKYVENAKIEVGVFLSKDQPFPQGSTIKDENIDWLTLYNGGDIMGRIDLNNLETNTIYYYMPYIIFNLTMTHGEIKTFKTEDNFELVGTWETYPYEHKTPSGEIIKERIVHIFDKNGNYTRINNYGKERYSYYYIQDLVNQDIHKLDQCKYDIISGTYTYDKENMSVHTVCTSFIQYWDYIETRTKEGKTTVTKDSGSKSEDEYLGQDFFEGNKIVVVSPKVMKCIIGNGFIEYWKISD